MESPPSSTARRTPRVLFLAQNRQEAQTLVAVARELGDPEAAEFLSLDPFFRQDAGDVARAAGFPVRTLEPIRPPSRPFALLSQARKLAVVLRNHAAIARACEGLDALVCCSDGALERSFIRAAQQRGAACFLVVNGWLFHSPARPVRRAVRAAARALGLAHLAPAEIGEGGCDRIFVPGLAVSDELALRGVPLDRLEATGCPRFAPLFVARSASADGGEHRRPPLRILYLTGAFAWHGMRDAGHRELRQLRILDEIVGRSAGGMALRVRPHPRASSAELALLGGLEHAEIAPPSEALEDAIGEAHVVASVCSTATFEAIALDRLALGIDIADVFPTAHERIFTRLGLWRTGSRAELEAALEVLRTGDPELVERARRQRRVFERVMARDTPRAAARIAAEIGRATQGAAT